MNKLFDLINEALDAQDKVREKLHEMLSLCEQEEGTEDIVTQINAAATPLVNANTALEDILSAVEDGRDV